MSLATAVGKELASSNWRISPQNDDKCTSGSSPRCWLLSSMWWWMSSSHSDQSNCSCSSTLLSCGSIIWLWLDETKTKATNKLHNEYMADDMSNCTNWCLDVRQPAFISVSSYIHAYNSSDVKWYDTYNLLYDWYGWTDKIDALFLKGDYLPSIGYISSDIDILIVLIFEWWILVQSRYVTLADWFHNSCHHLHMWKIHRWNWLVLILIMNQIPKSSKRRHSWIPRKNFISLKYSCTLKQQPGTST